MSTAAVEVTGLRKRYAEIQAVDGLSFAVAPGEIFGMLGPNGAGKTTTIEIILGLRQADAGTVRVLGMSHDREAAAIKARIGAQLQTTGMYPHAHRSGDAGTVRYLFPPSCASH